MKHAPSGTRGLRRAAALFAAVVVAMTLGSLISAPSAAADFPSAQLVSATAGGRCLDVDSGTQGNVRTNVQLYNCRAGNDHLVGYQLFDVISIPGRPWQEFKIRNQTTGKCLTYNPNAVPTPWVWAEACTQNGQGWKRLDGSGTSRTRFQAVETNNLCLDAVDPVGGQRTGIDLWTCDTTGSYVRWLPL